MLQHIASTETNSVSPRRTLPSVSHGAICAPYLPSAQPSPGPLDSKHIEAKPYCFSVSLASRQLLSRGQVLSNCVLVIDSFVMQSIYLPFSQGWLPLACFPGRGISKWSSKAVHANW